MRVSAGSMWNARRNIEACHFGGELTRRSPSFLGQDELTHCDKASFLPKEPTELRLRGVDVPPLVPEVGKAVLARTGIDARGQSGRAVLQTPFPDVLLGVKGVDDVAQLGAFLCHVAVAISEEREPAKVARFVVNEKLEAKEYLAAVRHKHVAQGDALSPHAFTQVPNTPRRRYREEPTATPHGRLLRHGVLLVSVAGALAQRLVITRFPLTETIDKSAWTAVALSRPAGSHAFGCPCKAACLCILRNDL